jgi:hypothetical protein
MGVLHGCANVASTPVGLSSVSGRRACRVVERAGLSGVLVGRDGVSTERPAKIGGMRMFGKISASVSVETPAREMIS